MLSITSRIYGRDTLLITFVNFYVEMVVRRNYFVLLVSKLSFLILRYLRGIFSFHYRVVSLREIQGILNADGLSLRSTEHFVVIQQLLKRLDANPLEELSKAWTRV